MQTFEPVYGIIIIYATSEAKLTGCVSIVQQQLNIGGISEEEKIQCHAVRRHFSQTKKKVCQHFLPESKRPALRAVRLFLRGEAKFNGTTLPLHLPTHIFEATASYM